MDAVDDVVRKQDAMTKVDDGGQGDAVRLPFVSLATDDGTQFPFALLVEAPVSFMGKQDQQPSQLRSVEFHRHAPGMRSSASWNFR